ncbi:Derlin 1 [Physocladia obscura]|uniref:Derlin n=1 Tax=Physocladia obscura TaxID=109957 RepID=A0AAD5XKE1_9FUNG|nr:Derlin 1 [Physocladia obscura]
MAAPAGNNNNLTPNGAMADAQAWFQSIPLVTRTIFAGSMGLSIAAGAGVVSPMLLFLSWPKIYKGFELETSAQFNGRKADYLFFVLISMAVILPVAIYMGQFILLESLVVSMLYVWSMNNKEQEVSFFFGLRFKAMFLPWDFLTGAPFPPIPKLIGIFAGHVYYFLDTVYPENNNGARLINTPNFLFALVGEDPTVRGMGGVGGMSAAPAGGRGQRLGTAAPAAAGNRWQFSGPSGAATSGTSGSGASGVRQRTGYNWGGSGQRLGTE